MSKAELPPPPDYLLNGRQTADSLGISPQAFARWGVEPAERRGKTTYYRMRDVVENRIARVLDSVPPAAPSATDDDEFIDPIREKALLDRERRKGELLKNDERMGVVFPVGAAGFIIAKMGAEIAGILEALPGQIKVAVPTLTARNIDEIKREIARARNVAASVGDSFDHYLDEFLAESDS